jgi:hypothetical protein
MFLGIPAQGELPLPGEQWTELLSFRPPGLGLPCGFSVFRQGKKYQNVNFSLRGNKIDLELDYLVNFRKRSSQMVNLEILG